MPSARTRAADVGSAIDELLNAVTNLVEGVERGASQPDGDVRSADARPRSEKLRSATSSTWASYTPAERAARVRKMLAGRGLKPKAKKPLTAMALKVRKSMKAYWSSMKGKAREARIAVMLKGRGLKRHAPSGFSPR